MQQCKLMQKLNEMLGNTEQKEEGERKMKSLNTVEEKSIFMEIN